MSAAQSVWLDTVEDRTNPEIDIDFLRGRGDFTADLVATFDSALSTAATRAQLIAPHLDDLPLREIRRIAGDIVDAEPSNDEIRAALELALDRVAEAVS